MIRDREDDLDLEVENEKFETAGKNSTSDLVRRVQHTDRAVRAVTDVPRQAVPRPMRADSYREIPKRHDVRKQTDRSFH